jgi:hypothetical protein
MIKTTTSELTSGQGYTKERAELRQFVGDLPAANFFQLLAEHLTCLFKVDYVLIGRLTGHAPETIISVGLSAEGKPAGEMEYTLPGTPCENVIGRNMCYYPCNVQEMFPHDQDLKDYHVESYLGLPLNAPTGKALGLIVLMHKKTIPDAAKIEALLEEIKPVCEQELQSLIKLESNTMLSAFN